MTVDILEVSNTSISGDIGSNGRGDAELRQQMETVPPPKEMDIIPTLHRIFPALGSLDLSYNALTTLKGVGEMFIPSPSASDETGSGPDRGGTGSRLKVLRVRGNKIDEAALDELVRIGESFKLGDAGMVTEWHGVEIDLRENEIGKVRDFHCCLLFRPVGVPIVWGYHGILITDPNPCCVFAYLINPTLRFYLVNELG